MSVSGPLDIFGDLFLSAVEDIVDLSGVIKVNAIVVEATIFKVSIDNIETTPSGEITFHGTGLNGKDQLVLAEGIVDLVVHSQFTSNEGHVVIDGQKIVHSGLERILDKLQTSRREFSFMGTGNDDLTITDDGEKDNGISRISSESRSLILDFTNPTDQIRLNSGDGNDFISLTQFDHLAMDSIFNAEIQIDSGNGDDVIYALLIELNLVLIGGNGNDFIQSGVGNDKIIGGRGSDILIGSSGKDIIEGGNGNDILFGDNALVDNITTGELLVVQTINPMEGNDDLIDAGNGDDVVVGGAGSDIISGDDGHDILMGDHGLYSLSLPANQNFISLFTGANERGGNDVIFGGDGDDFILGQQGNDKLFGGKGEDDILGGHNVLDGADGEDQLYGGNDPDVILGDNGLILRHILSGDGLTWQRFPGPNGAVIREISLFDDLDLNGGSDTISGGPGDDIIHGQVGDDILDVRDRKNGN